MTDLINVFFKNHYHNGHVTSTIFFIAHNNTRYWYYEGESKEGAACYGLKSCNTLHIWKAGHAFQVNWATKITQNEGTLKDTLRSIYPNCTFNYINTTNIHDFDSIYDIPKDARY